MQQLFIKFPIKSEYLSEDFYISPANNQAYEYISKWPNWGNEVFSNILLIYGETGSGKTHLAHIWQNLSNASLLHADSFSKENSLILEDIDYIDQEFLLHLINTTKENKQYLLLTSTSSPKNLNFPLADLQSRIMSIPSIAIDFPDQELLKAVLLKHLTDRNLKISSVAMDYITPRIDRSFSKLRIFIEKLDFLSKLYKKPLTIPLIKQALEKR